MEWDGSQGSEKDEPYDRDGALRSGARAWQHWCGARIVTMLQKAPRACHTNQGGCGRKRGPWVEVARSAPRGPAPGA